MKASLPLLQKPLAGPRSPQASGLCASRQGKALWLALYFIDLPLAVFAAEDVPLVIVGSGARRPVIAANEPARQAGIGPGLGLSGAYALAAGLQVRPRDEPSEQALLERLACWAMQFSSQVCLHEGAGLLIEVGGSLRLFGALDGLQERLRGALAELGMDVCHAIAPTPLAAWAMSVAPGADGEVVSRPEALRAVLGPYPIECLQLDEKRQSRLLGMGVKRLDDLWRLPHAGLAKRFGGEFVLQCRRLLGDAPDVLECYTPRPEYEGALPLVRESRNRERLLSGVERLLIEMQGLLRGHDAGVREVEIIFRHTGRAATRFRVNKSRPGRDHAQWLAVIGERLAALALAAPVCEIGLRARAFEVMTAVSGDLFAPTNADREPMDQLIERLAARLGSDCVQGLCAVHDHRPERAARRCQPGETTHFDGLGQPRRPILLLPQPRHLGAQPGMPVMNGPERIESGWWDGADVRRDYWVGRHADGGYAWVYQDHRDRHWYLHGWFA